jgi:hypothetical protein
MVQTYATALPTKTQNILILLHDHKNKLQVVKPLHLFSRATIINHEQVNANANANANFPKQYFDHAPRTSSLDGVWSKCPFRRGWTN